MKSALAVARPLAVAAPLLAASVAGTARAETLSTTSLGMANRTITYTPAKLQGEDTALDDTPQRTEPISDAIICERISTPSALGLELGAGGCMQGGGFWTFSQVMSMHVQLIYYPLASRARVDDDAAVRLNRSFFGDFFIVGQGGFAKYTHGQTEATNSTLTSDAVEFGGGVGWSYRISKSMALGLEGYYLVGSILSKATSGSTSSQLALGSLSVFL